MADSDQSQSPTRVFHPAVTSALDQVVLSGANFAVGFFLARYADESAFALYALAFIVVNIAGDLHRSLIWQPMNILTAEEDQETARARYGSTIKLSYGLAGLLLAAACVTALITAFLEASSDSSLPFVSLFTGIATFLFIVHEIQRRLNFLQSDGMRVLQSELWYLGGVATVLVAAYVGWRYQSTSLPSYTGLIALSAGALLGILWGRKPLGELKKLQGPALSTVTRRHWPLAKWNVVSFVLIVSSERLAIFVLSAAAGLSAVANFEAGRMLAMPLYVLVMGLFAYLLPEMSRRYRDHGYKSALRLIEISGLLFIAIGVLYGSALWFLGDAAGQIFFNGKFEHLSSTAAIWTIILVSYGMMSLGVSGLGLIGAQNWSVIARLPGFVIIAAGLLMVTGELDEVLTALLLSVANVVSWIVMWLKLRTNSAASNQRVGDE